MGRLRFPAVLARPPEPAPCQPGSKSDLFQLTRGELAKLADDRMQSVEDRVYHKAGIPHGSAGIKRNSGTKIPQTGNEATPTDAGMPARPDDPYEPDKIRSAIQAALDRAGVKKSGASKNAGMAERLVGKFLSGNSNTIQLASAIRLARALGITVSELIGEPLPKSPTGPSPMSDDELIAWQDRLLRTMTQIQEMRALLRLKKD